MAEDTLRERARYRRVVFEEVAAVQLSGESFRDLFEVIPSSRGWQAMLSDDGEWLLDVPTPKGVRVARPGDYVVQDSNGTYSVWAPTLFEQTFEKVPGSSESAS